MIDLSSTLGIIGGTIAIVSVIIAIGAHWGKIQQQLTESFAKHNETKKQLEEHHKRMDALEDKFYLIDDKLSEQLKQFTNEMKSLFMKK